MTTRRVLGIVLAMTLLVAAAWESRTRDSGPQSFNLLLLGSGLAVGAATLKRRRESPLR